MFANPGVKYAEKGWTPNKPVLIVPGLCSSALSVHESSHGPWVGKRVWLDMNCIGFDKVWDTIPGGRKHKPKKSKAGKAPTPASNVAAEATYIYGSSADAAAKHDALLKRKWVNHIMLDPKDGISDPEGIKVRPVDGLDGVMYLDPGALTSALSYVFGPLVETLRTLGYTDKNVRAVPYDWRLPPKYLEIRDGYFTKVKNTIEEMYHQNGQKKVVVLCHSLGNRNFHYFLRFMEKHHGRAWQSKFVESWVAIGPLFLGAPKSLRAVLTGERMGLEAFLFEFEGVAMIRSIGVPMWMWPIKHFDYEFQNGFAAVRTAGGKKEKLKYKDCSIEEVVKEADAGHMWEKYKNYYVDDDCYGGEEEMLKPPPIDKIFAIYGINLKTETFYFLRESQSSNPVTKLELDPDARLPNFKCEGGIAYESKDTRQNCLKGKQRSGDGTVPYASLAYCRRWAKDVNVRIAEIEGAEHRAILRNKTFTNLVIETVCQPPPPSELPNSFMDVTFDVQQEVKARNVPATVALCSSRVEISRSGAKTQKFQYDSVVDILMDESGEAFTIEVDKFNAPFIFKARNSDKVVQELASRCRFIALMQASVEEARDEYGRTDLHQAVIKNDIDQIKTVICQRSARLQVILVNAIDSSGCTPLHYAASRGFLDCINALLDCSSSVDVNIPDQKGNAPVHELVRIRFDKNTEEGRQDVEKWKLLMGRLAAMGMDINVVSTGLAGESPLHVAVKTKNDDSFDWLMSQCPNVNQQNLVKETPLHYAVRLGHMSMIKALLDAGADMLTKSTAGQTPMELAQASKVPGLYDRLKEYRTSGHTGKHNVSGRAVHAFTSKAQQSELITAVTMGELSKVFELLLTGSDVEEKDGEGRTPILCAAAGGFSDIVIVLLKKGARLDVMTSTRDTALHLFLSHTPPAGTHENVKYFDVLEKMRKRDVDMTSANASGNTPLLCALVQGNTDGAMWLLENMPNPSSVVNIQNTAGETALHYALGTRRDDLIKLLLSFGASPDTKALASSTIAPLQSPLEYTQKNCPQLEPLLSGEAPRPPPRRKSRDLTPTSSTSDSDLSRDDGCDVEVYSSDQGNKRKSFYLSSNTTRDRAMSSVYRVQVEKPTRMSRVFQGPIDFNEIANEEMAARGRGRGGMRPAPRRSGVGGNGSAASRVQSPAVRSNTPVPSLGVGAASAANSSPGGGAPPVPPKSPRRSAPPVPTPPPAASPPTPAGPKSPRRVAPAAPLPTSSGGLSPATGARPGSTPMPGARSPVRPQRVPSSESMLAVPPPSVPSPTRTGSDESLDGSDESAEFDFDTWCRQYALGPDTIKSLGDNACTDRLALELLEKEDLPELDIKLLGERKKLMLAIADLKAGNISPAASSSPAARASVRGRGGPRGRGMRGRGRPRGRGMVRRGSGQNVHGMGAE
eukprot:TRINITY_DN3267_c0_g1_i1.p1 TRINITY_DN3267_c0_g1~~TRINITY_DN3267_c0_g1_i1.p1  ORF type:complete len:1413 (+),score=388.34 TRINITY_DN3267_c0_g1_i1:156-4394(+)